MSDGVAARRIWLCADDYGMAPGVNRGIRELIAQRRINATSVMVVGPAIERGEIDALKAAIAENPGCAIGLHATLTAPFHPLTMHFRPLHGGLFLPLPKLLRTALLRGLDRDIIAAEIAAQIAAFVALVGRPPDYVDGHQHVQTFPVISDAVIAAMSAHAPGAWLRQCGSAQPLSRLLTQPKALLLDRLCVSLRKRAANAGIAVNSGFAGAYDFAGAQDFGPLMNHFLERLPDGGLVMCHPGYVDDVLSGLDPLTHQRERELQYLAGDDFPRLLAANHVALR